MTLMDYFKDFTGSQIRKSLRHIEEDILEMIDISLRRASRYLMRELLSVVFIVGAVIFLCIGIALFFVEYLEMSRTISMMIVGFILLFIGVIIKFR